MALQRRLSPDPHVEAFFSFMEYYVPDLFYPKCMLLGERAYRRDKISDIVFDVWQQKRATHVVSIGFHYVQYVWVLLFRYLEQQRQRAIVVRQQLYQDYNRVVLSYRWYRFKWLTDLLRWNRGQRIHARGQHRGQLEELSDSLKNILFEIQHLSYAMDYIMIHHLE